MEAMLLGFHHLSPGLLSPKPLKIPALPVMVETVSRKIEEYIVMQCLICCDVVLPNNARQSCNDMCSLIFPFQEKKSSCLKMEHASDWMGAQLTG
ncbi:hypothetical protein F3Y22_tig00110429pilonHSYRG01143 [Hibiscus syriacus]|uniref:Uncharacterized protein n=1 Tax=Hibiscus syriacus TaxID=106335 RepID=A0A6A3AMQ2_HIBSY|nr:hypothetical protein F3Y22_tig00110429pilonHSYRG01143 [Hibiscus syriacus]